MTITTTTTMPNPMPPSMPMPTSIPVPLPMPIRLPITVGDIEGILQSALEPVQLVVQDDSHLHAGHAGASAGRHFTVRMVCARFAGLNRLARHRLVYDALASEMRVGIHALIIDAKAPGEA
jgi:BolA family transcriptional regulator, general stress-responsive regulator